jgi:anti-anti-sigma factor
MSLELVPPDSPVSGAEAPTSPLVCSWTSRGLDAGWVRVAGVLNLATAPTLVRALREPALQTRLVVLDLRDLGFMDCSGVQAIVNASRRARQAGHRLVVMRGSPDVNRVFALTGSSYDIEIADLQLVQPRVQAPAGPAGHDPAA